MAGKIWGPNYNKSGWIAEVGEEAYQHVFGGSEWSANGPLDSAYGAPILILTLDLTDPRLAELKPKNARRRTLPLFSYINGMVESPQRYLVDHENRTATFIESARPDGVLEPIDCCPNPLPKRKLTLRTMRKSELPVSDGAYWTACETFCGGDGWLRVGGPPLWLDVPEKHKTADGKAMKYVAAIGYDVNASSPFLDESGPLMFGEMGLYFFVSRDLGEVVVSSQSS